MAYSSTKQGPHNLDFTNKRKPAQNMTIEVVDQSGYDSYVNDHGVLIGRTHVNTSNPAFAVVDSHPGDIAMVDYELNDDYAAYPLAHATQLADATFHAGISSVDTGYYKSTYKLDGTGKPILRDRPGDALMTVADWPLSPANWYVDKPGSIVKGEPRDGRDIVSGNTVNEWEDTENKLHFYILQKNMNEGKYGEYLSYQVGMLRTDGKPVGGELALIEGDFEPASEGRYAVQNYTIAHSEDADATDIVRVSLEGKSASNATILNNLFAVEPGEEIEFKVYIKATNGALDSFPGGLSVKVASESNDEKSDAVVAVTFSRTTGGKIMRDNVNVSNTVVTCTAGDKIQLKAVNSSDYGFSRWTGDTGYLSTTTAKETVLTVPDKAITIGANFTETTSSKPTTDYTSNSGDNSGKTDSTSAVKDTTVAPTVETSEAGVTKATVSEADVKKAIENAVAEAKKAAEAAGAEKTESKPIVITINVAGTDKTVATEATIKAAALKAVAASENTDLVVTAMGATLLFDDAALTSLGAQATSDLVLTVGKVAADKLTEEQAAVVGTDPVYELSLKSGETTITTFGGNEVSVTLPYALKEDQDANAVVIYYLDSEGNLQVVPCGFFDSTTGTVTFLTTHFSKFVIGHNLVAFDDVAAGFWAKATITQAAARRLVSGIGGGLYNPDSSVTRAEFVQMMVNVLALPAGSASESVYVDVNEGAWYYKAFLAAKSAGLLNGLDINEGGFMPDQPITREEMASVLAQALSYEKISVPKTDLDLSKVFTDFEGIGLNFKDAIADVVTMKLMQGTSDTTFDPAGLTTRAQAAQVQMNLLKLFAGILK